MFTFYILPFFFSLKYWTEKYFGLYILLEKVEAALTVAQHRVSQNSVIIQSTVEIQMCCGMSRVQRKNHNDMEKKPNLAEYMPIYLVPS